LFSAMIQEILVNLKPFQQRRLLKMAN